MKKTTLVAVVLVLCAVGASAGTITSIDPSWIRHNSGEQYLTIYGTGLGQLVTFRGPAGTYELDANWSDATHLMVWLPIPVSSNPGWYDVFVRGGTGTSNVVPLEVRGIKTFPFTILVPDVLRAQPLTREGVTVKYDVLAVGGDDPSPVVTCDPKSGSFFKMGVTRVYCIGQNRFGERAEASFDVNVLDQEPPIVKVPDTIRVQAESKYGARVEFESATAYDEIYGELQPSCSHRSGDMFPVGLTTVRCEATDIDFNTGNAAFTVEVLGDVKPYELTVHVPSTIFINAESREGSKVEYKVDVSGTEDREPEVSCAPKSGSLMPIGETVVRCTALDKWGMRGASSFLVNVVDPKAPVIEKLTATPDKLTPSDGRLYEVRIDAIASDEFDPAPVCAVFALTSNEDIDLHDGDKDKNYDWKITGPLSLELRARRITRQRTYDVWVGCEDFYGNRTNATVQVIVPYDGSGATLAPAPKRRSSRP